MKMDPSHGQSLRRYPILVVVGFFVALAVLMLGGYGWFWLRSEHLAAPLDQRVAQGEPLAIAKGWVEMNILKHRVETRNSDARKFVALFPEQRSSISYSLTRPIWNGEVTLYTRYELTMQLKVDREGETLASSPYGSPFILHLVEIQQKVELPNGQVSTTYSPASQRAFTRSDWLRLVEAKGELRAIGVNLETDDAGP